MNPVTVFDVEARWRPLSDAELIVADALLGDAWVLLGSKVTGLESRLQSGDLAPELVTMVVCAMVLRVLRNPDGLQSEAIEDYSRTASAAVASGELTVTDAELDLLAGRTPDAAGFSGAFSIRVAGEPYASYNTYGHPFGWVWHR